MARIELSRTAQQLARILRERDLKVVFAESCTGGLVAATLTQIPGISDHLCGSMVTYRGTSKIQWLNVEPRDVKRQQAVNPTVAAAMAQNVLASTPEADVAGAITGHLGPAAGKLDGVVYTAVARRDVAVATRRHQLQAASRPQRQREAARQLIAQMITSLTS